MWPTRSHERFIVYCLPFVVLMAVMWRSYRAVLLALLVLATAEQSWNIWLKGPHAGNLLPRLGVVEWTVRQEAENVHPSDAETSLPQTRAAAAHEPTPQEIATRLAQSKERREAPARQPAYARARERVTPWDAILTVLSIGAYAWAFVVTLRGPDPSLRKRQT